MKTRWILPAVYLSIAAESWLDFIFLPSDETRAMGLRIVAFPMILTDEASRVFGDSGQPFDTGSTYLAGVLIVASAFYWFGRALDART